MGADFRPWISLERDLWVKSRVPARILLKLCTEARNANRPANEKRRLFFDRNTSLLESRYGERLTLEEVGKRYGITTERVRQILAKVLRRLKHPSYLKFYSDYVEKLK